MRTRVFARKPPQSGIIVPSSHIDQAGLGVRHVAQAADEPLPAAGGAAFGAAGEAVLAIPGVRSAAAVRERVAVGIRSHGGRISAIEGSGSQAVGGIVVGQILLSFEFLVDEGN